MDAASNTFSYFVGGLALISTLGSILCYCCPYYLPTTQLRLLNDVLVETKDIYRKANDEGLLSPEVSGDAQIRLNEYEEENDKLREITYRAVSYIDTLCVLFKGHTRRIMNLALDVGELRAFLMTTSQEEKARRAKESPPTLPSESPAQAISELADDAILSNLPPLSSNDRTSTCLICSFLKRCSRKFSRTEAVLPLFVAREDREVPSSSTSTSSRTSTLVDEPARKSWSFPSVRLPVCSWTSLGCRADSQEPNCDIDLPPCDDHSTSV